MAKDQLMDLDKALELFEPVLGFEVHVELSTQTKMFSAAPNPAAMDEANVEPNTCITPLCLGLPGSLPVVNTKAVEYSISLGLALGCEIAPVSRFARKNYFYPDLAKNYQISQYDEPIAFEGSVAVEMDDGTLVDVPTWKRTPANSLTSGEQPAAFKGRNTPSWTTTVPGCPWWRL
jgi:aspartyl-tRNA(Asn)/glutamyl-tRNA(Gln) amidotransferase subunit B